MAKKTETINNDGFYSILLEYHDKEPLIANVVIVITAITPLVLGCLGYLSVVKAGQTAKPNIKKYAKKAKRNKKGHRQ